MRDIDKITKQLTSTHPRLMVEQLKVVHPGADDDGLWFFRHPSTRHEVQLESSTGNCPFLFETDANHTRSIAETVVDAIELVARGLGLVAGSTNSSLKSTPQSGAP
jgi:hypothetical protein